METNFFDEVLKTFEKLDHSAQNFNDTFAMIIPEDRRRELTGMLDAVAGDVAAEVIMDPKKERELSRSEGYARRFSVIKKLNPDQSFNNEETIFLFLASFNRETRFQIHTALPVKQLTQALEISHINLFPKPLKKVMFEAMVKFFTDKYPHMNFGDAAEFVKDKLDNLPETKLPPGLSDLFDGIDTSE